MRRTLLLALLILTSCKDEPPQPADCSAPDFDVIITALDAPLPSDTVVRMEYGGGEEEYRVTNDDGMAHNLFCDPSDREGNLVPSDGGQPGQAPSDGGEGGAGGAPSGRTVEALHCGLWTDGPATLTVETALYPVSRTALSGKKGQCTKSVEIEIGPDDGGGP